MCEAEFLTINDQFYASLKRNKHMIDENSERASLNFWKERSKELLRLSSDKEDQHEYQS